MFGDFKSKVLGSFRRIKKDMALLARTGKNLSRDVKVLSKKTACIDSLRKNNSDMRKQLDMHSKIIHKIANSKVPLKQGLFSRNPAKEFNSKISRVHSELKTEIEGLKYELSKSSENSYQAYSDSIIVQREIDYLKKENRILREEMSKRQDMIENSMSKEFSNLNKSIASLAESLNDIKGKSKTAIAANSGRSYDSMLAESISSELDAIKFRMSLMEKHAGERGPILASNVKSQKTIFSFNSVKPSLVKMFSRKPRKSKNKLSIDVSSDSRFEKSPGSASAKMEYMPQPWSKISGYKKVERKEKQSGYFW